MKTSKFYLVMVMAFVIGLTTYSCSDDDLNDPECKTCEHNEPFNIEKWTQTDSFEYQFTDNMINGELSSNGEYLFISSDEPNATHSRYDLNSDWDIQTIDVIPSQIDSVLNVVGTSNGVYAVFNSRGDYRYMKKFNSYYWTRQPVHTPFDLSTAEEEDEFNILASHNYIYMLPSGEKFFGIIEGIVYEYTSDYPEQNGIDAVGETQMIDVNDFLPNDGFAIEGMKFSKDGSRAFIYKSSGTNSAIVYQVDCVVPFELETAVYNGISVSFTTTDVIRSFQFTEDGKSFITIEGTTTQVIRKFC